MSESHLSIRHHMVAGLAIVIVLAFGVGGWAGTMKLSGAIIAPGQVVVDSNVKKVQHPTGGIVGELLVHDGDRVKAGQVLVRLDDTVTRANLAIVTKGLTELAARKTRLESERDGDDSVKFPTELLAQAKNPDVAAVLDGERKLFELRRNARIGQKEQLRQRIEQLKEEIRGFQAQKDSKEKQTALVNREAAGVQDLWKLKLVPLTKVTELQREAARLDGEAGQLIAQAAEAAGKISETELQIIQVDRDLASEVAKETREIDSKIGEYIERKVTAEDQLKRIDIRAPQDGMVFQSAVHTVGGVITAGDTIMQIVPNADQLSVESRVNPQDIDQIQPGQSVVLRLSTLNQRSTPELNGKVTRIAADVSTDQRTGQSYYLIRIAMPPEEIAKLGDIRILPGMPVEAFVQTGERTMISYLTKPLRDQVTRMFRE
ncbi:MAG TPA: HlyD family type I secretion periplasmic adaptor subunit [Pseudolabrys sp.]|nr:HlyD family type I secretion periplasmic adaptor subunit [Pseudolabrys sp.]